MPGTLDNLVMSGLLEQKDHKDRLDSPAPKGHKVIRVSRERPVFQGRRVLKV